MHTIDVIHWKLNPAWGPGKMSCINRCPHFWGKFLLRKHTVNKNCGVLSELQREFKKGNTLVMHGSAMVICFYILRLKMRKTI